MLLSNANQLSQRQADARLTAQKGFSERLLKRARFLSESDQALLRMACVSRMSRREIARLLKVSPGNLCRRLQKLLACLHDPLVVNLIERGQLLPADIRQLGIEHFLLRLSLPALAAKHQMSRHRVGAIIEYLRGWNAAMRCPSSG